MLSSTIENPDVKLVNRCLSAVLHSNLLDNMEDEKSIDPKSDLYFFYEEKYIADNPSNFDEDRIAFLRKEYFVICLIYLNHIFALTNIPILPTTWRPLIV